MSPLRILAVLFVLTSAGRAAAAEYVAVRYLPDQAPVAYLQVSADAISIAPSLEKLADAPVLRADPAKTVQWKQTDGKCTNYVFPEVELPSPSGGPTVRGALHLQRWALVSTQRRRGRQYATLALACTVATRDAAGATWNHSIYTSADGELSADPKAPTLLNLPSVREPKFAVETVVEGNKARIGGRLRLGETWVSGLTKNGVKAAAHLVVTNAAGKVVHTQKGDLEKFGFT